MKDIINNSAFFPSAFVNRYSIFILKTLLYTFAIERQKPLVTIPHRILLIFKHVDRVYLGSLQRLNANGKYRNE